MDWLQKTAVKRVKQSTTPNSSVFEDTEIDEAGDNQFLEMKNRLKLLEQHVEALDGEFKNKMMTLNKVDWSKVVTADENVHILAQKTEEAFQEFDVHVQSLVTNKMEEWHSQMEGESERWRNLVKSNMQELERQIRCVPEIAENCSKQMENQSLMEEKLMTIEEQIGVLDDKVKDRILEESDRSSVGENINKNGRNLHMSIKALKSDVKSLEKRMQTSDLESRVVSIETKTNESLEDVLRLVTALQGRISEMEREDREIRKRRPSQEPNKAQNQEIESIKRRLERLEKGEAMVTDHLIPEVSEIKSLIQRGSHGTDVHDSVKDVVLRSTQEIRKSLNSERYRAGSRAVQNNFILLEINEKINDLLAHLHSIQLRNY